jgi:hypothetical protein
MLVGKLYTPRGSLSIDIFLKNEQKSLKLRKKVKNNLVLLQKEVNIIYLLLLLSKNYLALKKSCICVKI